ncbi:PTS glucose transporter subunit IIA [Sphaerisporangium siamense]|uniref:PTS system N-acetylglucosamine-specific IIA component n=1 Tax=Sphaerisporangium siamense TaxID=795645 RepID=A0A7W7GDP3_9ACTN|nr:PTS glucose transporter subunit IIA [Sphaerisporangium siamense]MBB4705832.1 PTS system N-acetylglucosamine-specific IIA component [Sphaerisporangium siamense]GII82775.1 PTS glucose transporter subunit IIA [Sphaerisporangium siamense]
MTTVLAPVAGRVVGLAAVPDPVFSHGLVGLGTAIDPARVPGVAVAPIDGTVAKLHAHAYVIVGGDGRGVLVHLGIDTVELRGEGFRVLATEGRRVRAGTPIVAWNPALVEAGGRSPMCPVIALDAQPDAVALVTTGNVRAGERLFAWD